MPAKLSAYQIQTITALYIGSVDNHHNHTLKSLTQRGYVSRDMLGALRLTTQGKIEAERRLALNPDRHKRDAHPDQIRDILMREFTGKPEAPSAIDAAVRALLEQFTIRFKSTPAS